MRETPSILQELAQLMEAAAPLNRNPIAHREEIILQSCYHSWCWRRSETNSGALRGPSTGSVSLLKLEVENRRAAPPRVGGCFSWGVAGSSESTSIFLLRLYMRAIDAASAAACDYKCSPDFYQRWEPFRRSFLLIAAFLSLINQQGVFDDQSLGFYTLRTRLNTMLSSY